eukprot:362312-Rhodomonas_salina.1
MVCVWQRLEDVPQPEGQAHAAHRAVLAHGPALHTMRCSVLSETVREVAHEYKRVTTLANKLPKIPHDKRVRKTYQNGPRTGGRKQRRHKNHAQARPCLQPP